MHKYFQQFYSIQSPGASKFYPGLNAAKGILILLVIFTHCLPPGMILYFNYLFHMPVFLAISGFLLKRSVFNKGLVNYLDRISKRLIIPWVIACVIYIPFQLGQQPLSEYSIINLLYPFFHLWYVPAFIIAAMVSYCVMRFKIPAFKVLVFCGLITAVWYVVYRDNHVPVDQQPFFYLGEKRFYAYAFFFVLGFSLRNDLIKITVKPLLLFIILITSFAAIVWAIYTNRPSHFTVLLFMIFNTSLVLFILIYVAPRKWMQHKFLLYINKQSLGIFLYHPFIMFMIYNWIGKTHRENVSKIQGLGVGIAVVIIVLLVIWVLKKFTFTNSFILGNFEKKVVAKNENKVLVPHEAIVDFAG